MILLQQAKVTKFYPYVIKEESIPTTGNLVITLPSVTAQFQSRQVDVQSIQFTSPASSITDVWITDLGEYLTHSVGLSEYGSLPRYDEYVHLVRLQSSAIKVQGFYLRRNTRNILDTPVPRPFDYQDIATSYVIPSVYSSWINNSAVTVGTVYLSVLGDLWRCITAGISGSGLPSPTYSENDNTGFNNEVSGTAVFQFVGRSAYKDAWKVSPKSGIQWYFACISGGLLADKLPVQTKSLIKSMAFHCVNDWISGVSYTVGRKVGGANTQGRLWEAETSGITFGVPPFPVLANIGDTVSEGSLTWRCTGIFSHPSQRFFWYDTDPTLKICKSPDSHDSYAACFVWLVQRYLKSNPSDVAWLDDLSPHNGLTYSDLIKEIIYYNLTTQITVNNLTNTFQGTGVPGGGMYDANFLMDNCEVWAGLKSAELIYSLYKPNTGYAAVMSGFAGQILGGIEALWEPATASYKYVAGLVSMEPPNPGMALFYPLVMSQSWATLWGVPASKKVVVFDYMDANYSRWWARNDTDDLLACGAHYALTLNNRSRALKDEILDRIETERLPVGQADLYVHDAAYYIVMRDNMYTPGLM